MNTTQPDPLDIEDLLVAAGIEFTVVDRCPCADCEICRPREVQAAA